MKKLSTNVESTNINGYFFLYFFRNLLKSVGVILR